MWGIWLTDYAAWVRAYDPDAHDGRGDVVSTVDQSKAQVYPSLRACLDEWMRTSTVRPFRTDGKPNRPLSAYTIEPRRLMTADVDQPVPL